MPDDFTEFMNHLTDNARTSLRHADSIAKSHGSAYIGTEHLLLGVLSQESSVGAKVLADAGVTFDRTELALNLTPRSLMVSTGVVGLSETAKLTLKMSWEIAQEFHQDYLGTEHILYSILSQKNARATVLLRDMRVDISVLTGDLEDYFERQSNDYESSETTRYATGIAKTKHKGALGVYGVDLIDKAKVGRLDTVVGRDAELDRIITILSRRTKNNPVLIGEPGVGKTAIVEALADRIVREDVPDHMLDRRIVQLDIGAMIAGTKYRGEFEERLKKVIEELTTLKNIIVFVDELHILMGAGAAEGALDAANMLKPSLARGELHLIGATTFDEYRKHIEKDAALDRRFQTIVVNEPSLRETVGILRGLRPHYESHHSVGMPDHILDDVAYMADRYIKDKYMPDKAIDVLDEAAASVRARLGRKPSQVRSYTKQIKHLNDKMDDAVVGEDYERAALYKTRISQLTDSLKEAKIHMDQKAPVTLTSDDVAQAISSMTGIPLKRVMSSESKMLLNLERHLEKYVVGQGEAIERVSRAIRRSRSGISSSKRPIGSFVFMGPTGVGKTELARVLAREVFGRDSALIKLDMSEFKERHTASRLVGAPAGYVGYEDGGRLTDTVRRQPYSVVLFDEIEKAHPDISQLLLQLLEDGVVTDAKGRHVDFSNTVVILTSNLGADRMSKEMGLGFSARSSDEDRRLQEVHKQNADAARDALSRIMRPELLNRFDDIIVFHSLSRQDVGRIFDNMIMELSERLVQKGVSIRVSPSAKRVLIAKGYDDKSGARPLRRVIQDELEHPIAQGILTNAYEKGSILEITSQKGKVLLQRQYEHTS